MVVCPSLFEEVDAWLRERIKAIDAGAVTTVDIGAAHEVHVGVTRFTVEDKAKLL